METLSWVLLIVILLCIPEHFDGLALCAIKKRRNVVPPQPRVFQDVPRPAEATGLTEENLKAATGTAASFVEGHTVQHTDYLRCVHHMSKIIDPLNRVFHNFGRVEQGDGNTSEYISPLPPWCRFHWIPRQHLFDGLDTIVFVGDSVLLRAFHDIFLVPNEVYFQKIVTIDEILNGTVILRSGRVVKIFFVKNLFAVTFARTMSIVLDPKNGYVTPNSLVVTTLGMHDARWLIFRQQPPSYRKSQLGVWGYAKKYWNKHAGLGLDHLNFELNTFRNRSHWVAGGPPDGALSLHASDPGSPFEAPFIVFRDPVPPSCDHPKYANRKLITRCPDLLAPLVLPWYRDTVTAAAGALMGMPVVSVDSTMPPCGLIDAGHLYRWCNEAELQMLIQAYRLGRRLGIKQGRSSVSPKTLPSTPKLLSTPEWVAAVNTIVTRPFTVDGLPVISVPRRNTPARHFRVRFDGPIPPIPQWLPYSGRQATPEETPENDTTVLEDCCDSHVLIPPQSSTNDVDDGEEATDLYYHSIRLGIYLHATLKEAHVEENSSINVTVAGPPVDPYTRASFDDQPSMHRWGVFYERHVTEIITESEDYVPPVVNMTKQELPMPLPTYDAQLVDIVRRMVNLDNQGSQPIQISPPTDSSAPVQQLNRHLTVPTQNNEGTAILFTVTVFIAILVFIRKRISKKL